jgi:regulator of replication initiation timing
MDAGASILAFVQAAGKTIELIIEVKKLWDEAKGLPQELRDLLEELEILALDLQDLKEQLDHDRIFSPNQSKSSIERSFLAVRKARTILQGFVDEVNSKILSKKEGLQRTISSFKFLMKREMLENYQKRLKRAIDELHIAISIRHM